MIRIKICGITRASDARVAVDLGADAVGLIFAPSQRRVSPRQARAILAVVPPHVLSVGVFVNQSPVLIRSLVAELGLDRIQLHGGEAPGMIRNFPARRVIYAVRPKAGSAWPLRDPRPAAGALLVDAYVPGAFGGTGRLANWAYARHLKKFGKPVILSGGLNPRNVGEAMRRVNPDMVDVSSGVESRPGIKSRSALRAFIQAVRRADHRP